MFLNQDRTAEKISGFYDKYGKTLYRISYVMLCNRSDAEDAVQETFVRYVRNPRSFADEEHEKAWFIRVASNVCRDRQRFRLRHTAVPLQDVELYAHTQEDAGILRELLSLPAKCKEPLYLHYVEGYSVGEIAEILNCPESTVKSWLFRGRQKLRLELGKEVLP
jgi:RNA polymerase sigma factor (sigma-70 family)